MEDRTTRDLREATLALAHARAELVNAMRRAHAAGMAYRTIGELTGMSHESVRRLLRDK